MTSQRWIICCDAFSSCVGGGGGCCACASACRLSTSSSCWNASLRKDADCSAAARARRPGSGPLLHQISRRAEGFAACEAQKAAQATRSLPARAASARPAGAARTAATAHFYDYLTSQLGGGHVVPGGWLPLSGFMRSQPSVSIRFAACSSPLLDEREPLHVLPHARVGPRLRLLRLELLALLPREPGRRRLLALLALGAGAASSSSSLLFGGSMPAVALWPPRPRCGASSSLHSSSLLLGGIMPAAADWPPPPRPPNLRSSFAARPRPPRSPRPSARGRRPGVCLCPSLCSRGAASRARLSLRSARTSGFLAAEVISQVASNPSRRPLALRLQYDGRVRLRGAAARRPHEG